MEQLLVERDGPVTVVTLNRPEVRNAVNPPLARAVADAFIEFDRDPSQHVAVFTGANGTFCAGADLKAVSAGEFGELEPLAAAPARDDGSAPMGPSYLRLSKPVIAAVAGHAVAGGLELALWCDLRVMEEDAVFGVFCRRWGVPLVDGGTVRLPRLIGHSRALDLILTGRPVDAKEALEIGLANRVVPTGQARDAAVQLAHELCRFPQACLRNDRESAYAQWDQSLEDALVTESQLGHATLDTLETVTGATRFAKGKGRGGSFEDI